MPALSLALDAAWPEAAATLASPQAPSGIDFAEVSVAYRGKRVLDGLSLTAHRGEILALIGPSGSGKTTALRVVAGFVKPITGRIRIGGRDVTDLPSQRRNLGVVVQNYALFPHMRVFENVAFGLRARGVPRPMVQPRVQQCLDLVGMADFADRLPRELSGGQQQRVAIARALAIRPSVLLLDEPLSALDAQIRRGLVEEFARLHRELPGLTVLYVTHDQNEALTLAHRIAILRDGRLVAHGPSRELYRLPPNRFAADFLGRANLLPIEVEALEADGQFARVCFAGGQLRARARSGLRPGMRALLCVRPHDLALATPESAGNLLHGRLQTALWQGDQHDLAFEAGGSLLHATVPPIAEPPPPGSLLHLHFTPENASLITNDDG